jgi:glycosyltransferase involved in cell wall biosynthesis
VGCYYWGCPVICSESGGTKELVESNGLVLKEKQQYNYELFDYDNPPNIDVLQVNSLPNIKVDASKLDIKSVAQQYIDIFKQVVS